MKHALVWLLLLGGCSTPAMRGVGAPALRIEHALIRQGVESPKSDEQRMALAAELERRGLPLAALRHYVAVYQRHQSPEHAVPALEHIERIILAHDFPPLLVTHDLLGDRSPPRLPESIAPFMAYLEFHRTQAEGLGPWADQAQAQIPQDSYWFARLQLEEAEILFFRGDIEPLQPLLSTLSDPAVLPPPLLPRVKRLQARMAYRSGDLDGALAHLNTIDVPPGHRTIDDLERAWILLQLGHTGRALGYCMALNGQALDPGIHLERSVLQIMAWLDTCNPDEAEHHLDRVEALLGPDIRALRMGTPPEDIPLVRQLMRTQPTLRNLKALQKQTALEMARVLYTPQATETQRELHSLSQFIGQWEQAHRAENLWRAADELMRRAGQIAWLRHQLPYAQPHSPRPEVIGFAGPREFSALEHPKKNVFFPFDGEIWRDEADQLTVIGSDQCL